jgi:PAS domain S-box-containing protein
LLPHKAVGTRLARLAILEVPARAFVARLSAVTLGSQASCGTSSGGEWLTSSGADRIRGEGNAPAGGRRAREDLERFFALSLDMLCVADFNGYFTRVNPAFERVLGHTGEELMREPFMSFVHPDDREATAAQLEFTLGGGETLAFENRYRCRDGTYRWLQWASTTDRGVGLIYAVARDVTDAKQSEAELRALLAEQAALRRVATLVAREGEHAEVVAVVAEEVGKLLSALAAGVMRYEPAGRGTVVGTWTRDGSVHVPVGATFELDGRTAVGEVYLSGNPGHRTSFEGAEGSLARRLSELGYRSSLAAPIYVEGRLWGALAAGDLGEEPLAEDAEQRLARFAELVAQALANADARQQLAASRARLVEASDAERRRLERNLHDGAQQRLEALALTMRLAQARLAGDPDEAHSLLESAREELTAALVELRELARGIHPAMLSERGLAAALEVVVQRAPLPVEIQSVPDGRLPESVEVAAYYLVSEALVNVAKHAHASAATVAISSVGGRTVVEVADDGIGGADFTRGSGLRGLADRIGALGGALVVDSPREAGTTLRATIPCDRCRAKRT